MTHEELKKYDGKEGRPAYVACNGKIYDVTKSDFWSGGSHMGRFSAGEDLSTSIGLSPHGEANLFRYPVVGELTADTPKDNKTTDPAAAKKLKYQELYATYHPHPMMVHFPMGMFPLAFFLQVIALIVGGNLYLSFASIAAMSFATLFTIPAVMTGLLSFAINYNCKANIYLKRKIILSVFLFIIGAYASVAGLKAAYYAICPVAQGIIHEPLGLGYTVAAVLIMPIVVAVGYNGGKITWPR